MAIKDNLKKIINPVPLGGAPFFAEDFLNIQEKLSIELKYFYEELVRTSGTTFELGLRGAVINRFKNGVVITQPEIDNTDPLNTIIGAFTYYVDEEVIYFPGGVFNLSAGVAGASVVIFGADSGLKTSRVFKDASTKDMFIKYNPIAPIFNCYRTFGYSYTRDSR